MFNPQCEIYTFTIQLLVFGKIHHDLCLVGHITVSHQEFQGSYTMNELILFHSLKRVSGKEH